MFQKINKLLIAFVILMISCKKDDHSSNTTQGNGNNANNSSLIYPVALGNRWEYVSTISFVSPSMNFNETDYSIYSFDSITNFPNTDSVFALNCIDSTDNNAIFKYTVFYKLQPNGLFECGYLSGANPRVFLKTFNRNKYKVSGRVFNSLKELKLMIKGSNTSFTDSLIIEPVPLQTIQYPLIQNVIWTYNDYSNNFYIGKVYRGNTSVLTNVGAFNCWIIDLIYDMNQDSIPDSDIHITQFISPSKGLIKETQNIIAIGIDSLGNPLDTGIYNQTSNSEFYKFLNLITILTF